MAGYRGALAVPRNADPSILHATFRPRVDDLLARCAANGLQMALYEGGRSPARQVELYSRGRAPNTGTNKATNARAWSSFHQYSLAADIVFNIRGRWTWEEPRPGDWALFTKLAADCGLRTLSFERPHVELPVDLSALRAGNYPAGGGDDWLNWIETEIETWGRAPRTVDGFEHPGAPPLPSIDERPALVGLESLPESPFT